MKVTFLGTNGWYTSKTGNTPCVLVESKDYYVVFDAGNGLCFLDEHITQQKPIYLFISHFHLDHVSGLHTLAKLTFSQGLDVYVGEGRKKDFETLVNPPFTIGIQNSPRNVNNLRMEVRLHELAEGKHMIPFPVEVIEQFHAYRDHGFRVTLEGKTIAYSGDCGISKASYKLAKNADLLIHECAYSKPAQNDKWGHASGVEVAQLAKDAGVKQLILNHFDASQYTTLAKRKEAEQKAKSIFPTTTAAVDGFVLEL